MLNAKRRVAVGVSIILVLVILLVLTTASVGAVGGERDGIELIILMYHNVIPSSMNANKYEIKVADMEDDLAYIEKSGYRCITMRELIEYSEGSIDLPKRCVMLTFDDGFYYYNKLLLPLLIKYNLSGVVSVVGDFTRYNKNTSATSRYIYMDYDDMKIAQESGRIEIAAHSQNLHTLKNRKGATIRVNENIDEYKAMLNKDCKIQEDHLSNVGIKPTSYTYPYGSYCKESESVIKERGYKVTLTCNESINRITTPESLYLLGRYNRSGISISAQAIIKKQWSA